MYKVIAFSGLIAGASSKHFKRGYVRMPRPKAIGHEVTTDEMRQAAPTKLDWTTKGATTAVKDQGDCGSCWAFSTTETIESSHFMATGELLYLSEQQIVSCDTQETGCKGGDIPYACQYVMQNGGIELESTYPYTSGKNGVTGSCKSQDKVVVRVDGYSFAIPECVRGSCRNQREMDVIPQLAMHGPLAICLNAQTWDSYTGGIFDCNPPGLGEPINGCTGAAGYVDHCVQLVGYDTEHSPPYWKVRNSWGTGWGENGYIRIAMGKNVMGVVDEVVIIKTSAASSRNASLIV